MVALIAVVIIVAVTLLGTTLSDTFSNIQCQVSGKGAWVPGVGGADGACGAPYPSPHLPRAPVRHPPKWRRHPCPRHFGCHHPHH
jgi:pilus assembly protein Flp/PilA